MSNELRKVTTFNPITFDGFKTSDFQKESTKTAQIRQVIDTISFYASKQAVDNLTNSFYDNEDFGFEEQEFESQEVRVAFLNVPLTETEEGFTAKLAANPQAKIYKIMGNHPILTNGQQHSISRGLKTMEEYAMKQVVRYGENHENAGQLIIVGGKPNYKITKLDVSGVKDLEDRRTADPADYYATALIETELTGEVADATYHELAATAVNPGVGQTV